MKIGTKSVLYGAHCFLFHWLFVALGWFELYGFRKVCIGDREFKDYIEENGGNRYPTSYRRRVMVSILNPRLWIAFMIHDLGYWGKPNMDGNEGETHPEWAARKMAHWFGEPWGKFCLYHSRFYAKRDKATPSPLCYADKLAIATTPDILYLPFVRATGEIHEYMKLAGKMNGEENGKYATMNLQTSSQEAWLKDVRIYVRRWVEEHKDGREDTWTPEAAERKAETDTGVWK